MPVPRSARGRPSSDASKARRTGIALFLVFLVLAALLGIFFVWSSGQAIALGEDLCPKDKAHRPPRVVVILFDQTDRLSDQHRKALKSELARVVHEEFESKEAQDRLQFSRIEIFSFRSKPTGGLDIQRKLALCNPGSVTALTKWTANPQQVRRRFEQQFLERLERELDALMEFKETGQSPILEAIKEVSLTVFALPRYDASEKRLVIASDMLHNTNDWKQHNLSQRSFAEFSRTPYGASMTPNLARVEVSILLFALNPQFQTNHFMNVFWAAYFERAGVTKRDPFLKPIR